MVTLFATALVEVVEPAGAVVVDPEAAVVVVEDELELPQLASPTTINAPVTTERTVLFTLLLGI